MVNTRKMFYKRFILSIINHDKITYSNRLKTHFFYEHKYKSAFPSTIPLKLISFDQSLLLKKNSLQFYLKTSSMSL